MIDIILGAFHINLVYILTYVFVAMCHLPGTYYMRRATLTAIERTAYPRFKQTFTEQELTEFYTLTDEEEKLVRAKASGSKQQLALAILLKGYQKLGYLPRVEDVPKQIRHHIATQLTLPKEADNVPDASRKRYRQTIRTFLHVKPYGQGVSRWLWKQSANPRRP